MVWLVGGQTLVGLHQFPDPADDLSFNERRVGLDHLAFNCADRNELEQWPARLDELGIAHGGIVDASYGSGVSFRDPDGIALEILRPAFLGLVCRFPFRTLALTPTSAGAQRLGPTSLAETAIPRVETIKGVRHYVDGWRSGRRDEYPAAASQSRARPR